MAKQIKRQHIIEDDHLGNAIKSAKNLNEAIKTLSKTYERFAQEVKETAKLAKDGLIKVNPNTASGIKKINEEFEKSARLQKAELDIRKKQEQLKQAELRTENLLIAQKKRASTEEARRIKGIKSTTSAYKTQSATLNNLRHRYKDLAVANKDNTKEAKKLLKEITALDTKLKKIDRTVGQNQREVGNYTKALGGLKKVMGALGITFAASQLISFGKDLIELSSKAKGTEFAFERLGIKGQIAFERVKKSTRGLLSELDIKKTIVEFDNFNLNLTEMNTLMEFAAVRSAQTGDSIDFMLMSLKEGLSKGSLRRLDNLGVSMIAMKEVMAEFGLTVEQAFAKIASQEVERAGDILDDAANSQAKWTAELEDTRLELANKFKPVFDSIFKAGAKLLKFFSDNFDKIGRAVKVVTIAFVAYKAIIIATTKSFKIFNRVSKANVLGLIVTAVTSLIALFPFFTSEVDDNTDSLNENNKEQDLLNQQLEERIKLINKLNDGLEKGNSLEFETTANLKLLKEEYDDVLSSTKAFAESLGLTDDQLNTDFLGLFALDAQLTLSGDMTDEGTKALEKRRLALVHLAEVEAELLRRGVGGGGSDKEIADKVKLTQTEKDWIAQQKENLDIRKQRLKDEANFEDELAKEKTEREEKAIKDEEERIDSLFGKVKKDAEARNKIEEERLAKKKETEEEIRKLQKETIEQTKVLVTSLAEQTKTTLDLQINSMNDRISESQEAITNLQNQANLGNLDAKESIKAEKEKIANEKANIENLENKKKNLLLLVTTLQLALTKLESGDGNGLSAARTEVNNLIANMKPHYDGTGTTIGESLGNAYRISGERDTHIAKFHEDERIIGVENSRKLGDMGQDDIVKGALLYKNGQLAGKRALIGVNRQTAFNDMRMVDAVDRNTAKVTQAIKNIPESSSDYDTIRKVWIDTTRRGNKIERNHKPMGGVFS